MPAGEGERKWIEARRSQLLGTWQPLPPSTLAGHANVEEILRGKSLPRDQEVSGN